MFFSLLWISEDNNRCTMTVCNCLMLLPPQRGSQPDREASQGQDEQLHRRAGVAGAHLQRHVPQTRQADGAAHGRPAHEDTQRLG